MYCLKCAWECMVVSPPPPPPGDFRTGEATTFSDAGNTQHTPPPPPVKKSQGPGNDLLTVGAEYMPHAPALKELLSAQGGGGGWGGGGGTSTHIFADIKNKLGDIYIMG